MSFQSGRPSVMVEGTASKEATKVSRLKTRIETLIVVSVLAVLFAYKSFSVLHESMTLLNASLSSTMYIHTSDSLGDFKVADANDYLDDNATNGNGDGVAVPRVVADTAAEVVANRSEHPNHKNIHTSDIVADNSNHTDVDANAVLDDNSNHTDVDTFDIVADNSNHTDVDVIPFLDDNSNHTEYTSDIVADNSNHTDVDASAFLNNNTTDGNGDGVAVVADNSNHTDIDVSDFLNDNATDGNGDVVAVVDVVAEVVANRSQHPNYKHNGVSDRIPTPDARKFYDRFRHKNATIVVDQKVQPQPKVEFRGVSGLGHRLFRQSALFHTARVSKFPHMYASWGWECGKNEEGHPDIFDNLFGFGPMTTEPEANARGAVVGNPETLKEPRPFAKMTKLKTNQTTRIVNYVVGYRFMTVCNQKQRKMGDIYEMAITGEQFFRQLRTLFRFNDRVRNFTDHYSFSERIVLGVHIRSGNGETGGFEGKKRGFLDIDEWIRNASASLKQLATKMAKSRSAFTLPPLVFVATDDASVIEKLTNATKAHGIETVSFPQRYLPEGAGVNYENSGKGEACHESWIVQMIDAIVLGASDAVLAARYSSFSQSLPLYTVLADSIYRARPPDFDPKKPTTYFETKDRPPKNETSYRRSFLRSFVDKSFIDNSDEDLEKYSNRLFCESNVLGNAFDCYDDYFRWLLKDERKLERQIAGNKTLRQTYNLEAYVPCP